MTDSMDRRRFLQYTGLAVAGAALSGPLVGSAADASTSPRSARTVGVTLLAPLTGGLAPYGPGQATAYQNAIKWFNDLGGVSKMGGAKLALTVKDTESTPSVAADAVVAAAQDPSIAAIFGSNQSGASLVVAQLARQYRIPFVTSSDIDPRIAVAGDGWAFQIPPQAPLYSRPIIDFIDEQSSATGKSGKKMAILYSDGALGEACTPPAVRYAKEKGFDVAFVDAYTTGSVSDFTPYISKYQAAGVDALVGTQDPEPALLIVQAMQQLNWQPTVLAAFDGSFASDTWISTLGKAANYCYSSAPWYFNIRAFKMGAFRKEFIRRFGHQPASVDQIAFAAVSVLADSLERAGSDNRAKLQAALGKTNLRPAEGPIPCLNFAGVRFNSTGVNTLAENFVGMVKDGTSYVVSPQKYARVAPVWPRPAWSAM